MKNQNITLSLPKELLEKVKRIAFERNTSVSGLLRNMLEELVRKEDLYEKAYLHHTQILKEGFNLGTDGKIEWRREELYERK